MPKITREIKLVDGVPLKIWFAPSSSEDYVTHFTFAKANEDGEVHFFCSCKGFAFTATCWHITAAQQQ